MGETTATASAEDPLLTPLRDYAAQCAVNEKAPDVPQQMEAVLQEISRVGVPYYTWALLRNLVLAKMLSVLDAYNEQYGYNTQFGSFAERRTRIVEALRSFDGAPFTIQRLVEVISAPQKQVSD